MKRFIAAGAILASLVAIGVISSSNAEQSGSTIYACTTLKSGNIIRVSLQPVTCPTGSTPIQWGAGAQGPKGDKGETGSQGIPGERGDKGDPGLSYEQAIASVNDSNSSAKAIYGGRSAGVLRCIGVDTSLLLNNPNDSTTDGYCVMPIHNRETLSILSFTGTSVVAISVVNGVCPKSYSSASISAQPPAAILISGQQPIKISVPSSESCLIIYNSGSPFQLIYAAA